MLNIFYGTKLNSYVWDDAYRIADIALDLEYNQHVDLHKEQIPRLIEGLRNKKSHLAYIGFRVVDKEVFICETKDTEILDVGHKVILLNEEGKITGRIYDPTNDIMFYYTDIVMEKITTEASEQELEEKTANCISVLEEIYDTYFNKINEKGEKKGFFKRLFN